MPWAVNLVTRSAMKSSGLLLGDSLAPDERLRANMNSRKKLFSTAMILVLLLIPQNGNSCGPFLPDAVFIYPNHPGAPLPRFARGNLGVVLPDFSFHYLFVAYRYFSGRPLRPDEIDQVISFWKWRLISPWAEGNEPPDPVKEWTDTRKLLTGPGAQPPGISTDLPFGNYSNFHNCLPDAFHNAALALKDRVQRFGATSTDVQEWLHGQDMVFDDCGAQRNIPSPVAPSSPAWLKADREYQIAAAYFYSGKFDQAAQEFDQIAVDHSSPWRTIAPYLAARALIRKATLKDETPAIDVAAMNEAEVRLKKIVADPSMANMHSASRKLLSFIAIRLDPEQRIHELAPVISAEHPDPNLHQDLIDYIHGLDQAQGEAPDLANPEPESPEQNAISARKLSEQQYAKMADLRKQDNLTDWILTFRNSGDSSRRHALEQWRHLHSVPWLVAAITKVEAGSPEVAELLQAAERVPASSPAFPTVTYFRLRLLIQAGNGEKARALLDSLLPQLRKSLTYSSLNLFLILRMNVAHSLDEFLGYAALPVADEDDGSGEGPWTGYCEEKDCPDVFAEKEQKPSGQRRFDRQTAMVFNLNLPLQQLAIATRNEALPAELRGELAASTWTRAVMLDHHDLALPLVPEISSRYPALKGPLQNYVAAGTPAEKWHAALFILLSTPGLRPYVNSGFPRSTHVEEIDNLRDNWWCNSMGSQPEANNFVQYNEFLWGPKKRSGTAKRPKNAPPYPSFLSDSEIGTVESEWNKLAASGSGPDYLASKAIEWAKEQPNDPRIPEALHLAVRSTRYGCEDKQTSSPSHKAFDLLHSHYPNSKWTKQTPYWF